MTSALNWLWPSCNSSRWYISIIKKEETVSKFHFASLFRESLTRRRSGGAWRLCSSSALLEVARCLSLSRWLAPSPASSPASPSGWTSWLSPSWPSWPQSRCSDTAGRAWRRINPTSRWWNDNIWNIMETFSALKPGTVWNNIYQVIHFIHVLN